MRLCLDLRQNKKKESNEYNVDMNASCLQHNYVVFIRFFLYLISFRFMMMGCHVHDAQTLLKFQMSSWSFVTSTPVQLHPF